MYPALPCVKHFTWFVSLTISKNPRGKVLLPLFYDEETEAESHMAGME